MKFAKSPLRLDFYIFPSVRVEADLRFANEPPAAFDKPLVEDLMISVNCHDRGDAWALSLSVRCDPTEIMGKNPIPQNQPKVKTPKARRNFGYAFEITAVGDVAAHPELIAGRPDHSSVVQVTGLSLLYSSIRELLHTITSKGPYPAIVLPTMSFIPEGETIVRAKPASVSKKPKSSRAPKA